MHDEDEDSFCGGPINLRTIALGVACWTIIIAALVAVLDWVVPIPVGMAG